MIWEEYLNGIAATMGIDASTVGMMISLLFMMGALFVVGVATRGHFLSCTLTGLGSLIFFVLIGWLPYFLLILVLLLVAALWADTIRGLFGGGK